MGHHPLNMKKVSALKSEILIKYKKVNQMDPTRETLRLFASQGDKNKIIKKTFSKGKFPYHTASIPTYFFFRSSVGGRGKYLNPMRQTNESILNNDTDMD